MNQVKQLVKKIRAEALKGAPLESTLIWESPVDASGMESNIYIESDYKRKVNEAFKKGGTVVQGMVLSGNVLEVGSCRNCEGDVIQL